jgi:hypothetical protein
MEQPEMQNCITVSYTSYSYVQSCKFWNIYAFNKVFDLLFEMSVHCSIIPQYENSCMITPEV